jgi:hypothetical protein
MDQKREQPVQAGERFAPQAQYFSMFSLTANAAEAQLLVGRSRIVVGAAGGGDQWASEWLMGLTMSPVTMKDLSRKLAATVATYEKTFGPIPEIPGGPATPVAETGTA